MWATQYPAYKTAAGQMGSVAVSAMDVLRRDRDPAAISAKRAIGRTIEDSGNRRRWAKEDWIGFTVIGVFGLVPASALLAWGTERSTTSNAALIYLTVPPILTALLAPVILGERMT